MIKDDVVALVKSSCNSFMFKEVRDQSSSGSSSAVIRTSSKVKEEETSCVLDGTAISKCVIDVDDDGGGILVVMVLD